MSFKNKGQLSIDFLFAIMYATVLINMLFLIQENFIQNQNLILIRAQEKRIGFMLAESINTSQALSDGDTEISFSLPGIRYMPKTRPMPCAITINDDSIDVLVDIDGEEIISSVKINPPHGVIINNLSVPLDLPISLRCGEEVTIRYEN